MADNLDDDILDNPKNAQPKNSPDKTISLNDTHNLTPKRKTENMEVYHHPDFYHTVSTI
jgi:hypothetical protein